MITCLLFRFWGEILKVVFRCDWSKGKFFGNFNLTQNSFYIDYRCCCNGQHCLFFSFYFFNRLIEYFRSSTLFMVIPHEFLTVAVVCGDAAFYLILPFLRISLVTQRFIMLVGKVIQILSRLYLKKVSNNLVESLLFIGIASMSFPCKRIFQRVEGFPEDYSFEILGDRRQISLLLSEF